MKKLAALSLLALAVTGLLPAQPAADRFSGIKVKIDALLNPRLKPDPLPEKPANPFQFTLPGSVALAPAETVPNRTTPNTLADDDQILAYCVSRLRISGQVLRGGVTHLLINSATYKETDLVPLRASGDIVYYIRIVHIDDREVTFSYNNASLVVQLP